MLHGKIVLVTGASRGIGRAVAKSLAQHAATVILLSRTVRDLESVYDEIVQNGHPEPCIHPFNLCTATATDYDDLRRAIADKYGRLDGLIHNAGMLGALTPLEHFNLHTWYQVLQVNLNSVLLLTQACMPLLKLSARGSIIFTESEHATVPKANWGAYGVASAARHAMQQMLAAECENITNIRVDSVRLNKIRTMLRAEAYPAEDESHLLEPNEVVDQFISLLERAVDNSTLQRHNKLSTSSNR